MKKQLTLVFSTMLELPLVVALCALADLGLASGAAMDQGENLVEYAAASSPLVFRLAFLLNDVVNKDLTRTHMLITTRMKSKRVVR